MNDTLQIGRTLRNERGIALLVVLLVTALLIALIFEFAYATRISLNTAVNFRDSQRAYYLARSGIYAFINYGSELRKYTPQGEWGLVPVISEGDTQVLFKWEDESGKIKITDVKKDTPGDPRTNPGPTLIVLRKLFENIKGIDTAVLDRIADPQSDISNMTLLSGLHQYMSNEDFIKVSDSLTMAPVSQNKLTININTASKDVLQSLWINETDAQRIIDERRDTPYIEDDLKMNGKLSTIIGNVQINNANLAIYLTTKSYGYYTVSARATVGGYTKQIEAIVKDKDISYWRSM